MAIKTPALFLDRDGVINEDCGYVHKPEDTVFISGIFELVRAANVASYKVIVVTNQAGIGRGYYSESDFLEYMEWQTSQFRLHDARIDAVYFCPHHPIHGIGDYKRDCTCRKPSPGLIERAVKEHNLDVTNSMLVGDKMTDIASAMAANVGKSFLFSSFSHQKLPPLRDLLKVSQLGI